jgi:hypothetical protein
MANFTLDLHPGATNNLVNQVTQAACVAAESSGTLTISMTGNLNGTKRRVMFMCDQAWFYRSTTADATKQIPIAANTPFTLEYNTTTIMYFLRQTADGTLYAVVLA